MLQEDPLRTHVPADPDRIAALYESTNQPLVQPTGRAAQSAQAALVAIQDGALYDVVIALTLSETGENIVYAGVPVQEKELMQAIEEALTFAESMGFILDASGWNSLDADHRAELIERMPAFRPPGPRLTAMPERTKDVDPVYLESSYYMAPEAGGEKAYALLFEALRKSAYSGVAKIAMHNREHIVILRPGPRGILLHTMYFTNEIRQVDEFRTDLDLVKEKELALANTLIEALAAKFEPEK